MGRSVKVLASCTVLVTAAAAIDSPGRTPPIE